VVAVASRPDEARVAQDAKVLRDRAERHLEPVGDLAGGQLAIPDEMEDLASVGLRDDLEGIHPARILATVEMAVAKSYCSRD
jgi:hypothetical protein